MQTVWSRAAQARSVCNCTSCLLTANAIARRATTATVRRTIRVGDVFTVSLSSLAAGLAFAGSRVKDDRRKQWDKAIGEARASVEATEIQQQSRLTALSEGARGKALDDNNSAGHDFATERAVKELKSRDDRKSEEQEQRFSIRDNGMDTWLDVFDWARDQHDLREASGFQDWKGPSLRLLLSLSRRQLDELLSDERLLRRFYGGPDCNSLVREGSTYPLSMKKIRTLEWSVAKMVLKLLMYASRNSSGTLESSGSPTNSLLHEFSKDEDTMQSRLDHARERLRALAAKRQDHTDYGQFARPQAPNYDCTTVEEYEKTNDMNIALEKLLEAMEQETDSCDLISKICYNLLTARTPPNIHTYNMLLIRFCVLEKTELVRAVLTSIRESHVRPNEITHATFLRHFTTTGNLIGFHQYWKRMDGYGKRSVMAIPGQHIHPILRERYLVYGPNRQKIVEKGRMNGDVYESLIVGALQFLGGQTAMRLYRKMISEGWGPGPGILLAILQDCCHKLDWTVGAAVLEQLEQCAARTNTVTYEWMLRLCQWCGQQEFFNQTLRNGVHCGALPASMLNLPDHAKDEDVAILIGRAKDLQPRKAVGTLAKTAATISYRLGDNSPFLMENVLHGCEEEATLRHTINQMNDRWKARLVLQNRLDLVVIDINRTVLRAFHVLYASKHQSSVKFWLSGRVKHLEKELEQSVNSVACASYLEAVRYKEIQRTQVRRPEIGEGESGKSEDSAITAGSAGNKAEHLSHLPPGNRQRQLVPCTPPSLPPTPNTPVDPFWNGLEERMATTA